MASKVQEAEGWIRGGDGNAAGGRQPTQLWQTAVHGWWRFDLALSSQLCLQQLRYGARLIQLYVVPSLLNE